MLANHRLVRALLCQKVDKTPIWIMRQAGRYLPEYRDIRKKAGSFLTLCKTPELACRVTLQPLERFPLDAAIIFSDILTIPDAYGMGLYFEEGEGPCFKNPIRTLKDIQSLPQVDPEGELRYVMDALRMTRHALQGKVPLIGFAGSPWTIATYMVEGRSSKHFNIIKRLRFEEPQAMHSLLNHLANTLIDYLNAQIAAGAEVLMLFDTWGGILSEPDYLEFSLSYMKKIIQGLTRSVNGIDIPVIVFTKNGGKYLANIAQSGCHAIGLDWTANIKAAKDSLKTPLALQGNLDPTVLYAKPQEIQNAVKDILAQFGTGGGHVFNLGHGIPADVSLESVAALIEAVHTFSQPYHRDVLNECGE